MAERNYQFRERSQSLETEEDLARKFKDYAEMLKIGEAEIENAKATIPLVEFDSRLGFEPTVEYMADREHIEWKISITKQVMNEEIKPCL